MFIDNSKSQYRPCVLLAANRVLARALSRLQAILRHRLALDGAHDVYLFVLFGVLGGCVHLSLRSNLTTPPEKPSLDGFGIWRCAICFLFPPCVAHLLRRLLGLG